MTGIITNIDYENKVFYIIKANKKNAYYLSRKTREIFFDYLQVGIKISFKTSKRRKTRGNVKATQVIHIEKIVRLSPKRQIVFNFGPLTKKMLDAILQYKYYLFIDFEMTMGPHYKKYTPEIIQSGYVLIDNKCKIIKNKSYYVHPKLSDKLNKRTLKFLSLDNNLFKKKAKSYKYFYNDLNDIIKKYNPAIITWGSNDKLTLNKSYQINYSKKITNDLRFIDLQKVHRQYFKLKNDMSLFKLYNKLYPENKKDHQAHHAGEDAMITFLIFNYYYKRLNTNKDL